MNGKPLICWRCGAAQVLSDGQCLGCGAGHDENGRYEKPVLASGLVKEGGHNKKEVLV